MENFSSSDIRALRIWTDLHEISKGFQFVLKKVPQFEGEVYRGMVFPTRAGVERFFKNIREGEVWETKYYMSSSQSKTLARNYMVGSLFTVFMIIKSKTGRDISKVVESVYGGEEEVVFFPGTSFICTQKKISSHPNRSSRLWLEEEV